MEDLEIEVKFHCMSLGKIREKVLEAGAQSQGRVFEKNTLYDREGELGHRLSILRLRQDKKCTLTYKEPVPGSDPGFKIVKELEIEVDNFQRSEQILESLGFLSIRKYEKWRETFVLDQTKILLDTMPCGVFLELEGRRKPILSLAGQLGFDWDQRIILNYMQIFEIVRKGEGIQSLDFTFDTFEGRTTDMERYAEKFFAGKAE